jgi:hypothetical protein
MRQTLMAGVCLLALVAAAGEDASARTRGRSASSCADATEVNALQTVVVQQELMDAALGCGDEALRKFNAFQTAYGAELRKSDKVLLTMFKRIQGPARGDATYNLFKTNMASKAEIRRVHDIGNFCAAADLVFAAALADQKPSLYEFVSGVQVEDTEESPVGKCDVQVAVTLQGVMAGPNIVPKPNPLRVAAYVPPEPLRTPASLTVYTPPPAGTPAAPAPEQTATQEQKPADKPAEKKKGFLSGLFGGSN